MYKVITNKQLSSSNSNNLWINLQIHEKKTKKQKPFVHRHSISQQHDVKSRNKKVKSRNKPRAEGARVEGFAPGWIPFGEHNGFNAVSGTVWVGRSHQIRFVAIGQRRLLETVFPRCWECWDWTIQEWERSTPGTSSRDRCSKLRGVLISTKTPYSKISS